MVKGSTNKRSGGPGAGRSTGRSGAEGDTKKRSDKRPARKMSEYGKQLHEKQKVKRIYGVREKQFRRFFKNAVRQEGKPGDNLLSMLESRLDNVLYRLKMSVSRAQARQIIVHGHVLINGKKVYSPSFLVHPGNMITFAENVADKKVFVENVINKRMNVGIKVPEWLELNKKDYKGQVLRSPVRDDIQTPIEEHLIVELYSK